MSISTLLLSGPNELHVIVRALESMFTHTRSYIQWAQHVWWWSCTYRKQVLLLFMSLHKNKADTQFITSLYLVICLSSDLEAGEHGIFLFQEELYITFMKLYDVRYSAILNRRIPATLGKWRQAHIVKNQCILKVLVKSLCSCSPYLSMHPAKRWSLARPTHAFSSSWNCIFVE